MRVLLIVSVLVAVVMAVLGILAPVLSPYEPLAGRIDARLIGPGGSSPEGRIHVLGTDRLGRDVLSRIVSSFRTTLYIGLVGTLVGVLAAWLVVMVRSRRNPALSPDTRRRRPLFGVPLWGLVPLVLGVTFLPALTFTAMIGPSLTWLIVLSGVLSAVLPMALIHESARNSSPALSPVKVALWSGFANSPIAFTLAMLTGLLIESYLSFLGVGVPRPHPSLGGVVFDGGAHLATAPWVAGFPALVLLVGVAALAAISITAGRGRRVPQPGVSLAGQAETLPYAGFWIRLGAHLIDSALMLLAVIPLVVISRIGSFTESPIAISVASVVIVVGCLAYISFYVWIGVKSPGKRALGLRILRPDGSLAVPARRFSRFLADWCLGPFAIISILMIALRKDKRGLHDLLLDTVVVRSGLLQRLPPTATEESEPSFEVSGFGQADYGGEGHRWDAR